MFLFKSRPSLSGVSLAAVTLVAGAVWLRAQRSDSRPLSSLLPAGALLYLEAKDFHRLLEQWNSSDERRSWLVSKNASVLGQSRLLQRLMQAQTQFATVAGLPIEMSLANELAGAQSAFAFYDFSSLYFVYLTRLEGPQLDRSSLWNSRGSYQARSVAGIPFYVRAQADGGATHTVAFASHDGWLAVATEPGLLAHTLALLAGQPASTVAAEPWFADTVKQIPQQGDLRLVYDLTALRKTPQFRTYWIQRNGSELAAFTAGSADVFEQPTGFEERRVLLRGTPFETGTNVLPMTQLLSHIPQGASLYRAWAQPNRDTVRAVLQQVILGESTPGADMSRYAPQVSSTAPIVGSESDLETRIDEPAFQKSAVNSIDEVTDVVMAMQPRALLHSQATRLAGDQVFVMPESEVALICAKADRAALDEAILKSVSVTKTGSLDELRTSVEGGALVLSRLALHPFAAGPAVLSGAAYAAGYEHSTEWPRYKRLFDLIDRGPSYAPAFFSSNLGSLGDSLSRLQRASIITQNQGTLSRDTVRYEFAPK